MKEFIKDKKDSFTDKQLIRALYLCQGHKNLDAKRLTYDITQKIYANIMSDKFDFRRGNTLASFAEAILKMIEY